MIESFKTAPDDGAGDDILADAEDSAEHGEEENPEHDPEEDT